MSKQLRKAVVVATVVARNSLSALAGAVFVSVLYKSPMTDIEIRAAHRIGAALLKQSREKMRDTAHLRCQTRTLKVIVA